MKKYYMVFTEDSSFFIEFNDMAKYWTFCDDMQDSPDKNYYLKYFLKSRCVKDGKNYICK